MDREKAREIMLTVGGLMDRMNIPFFLIQGTALGAWRDEDFVPSERDIDFGVLIEHLRGRQDELTRELWNRAFHVRQIIEPFDEARTIVAEREGVKVDIVGFIHWEGLRFAATPLDELSVGRRPYALCHARDIVENWGEVRMFGRDWNIPSRIEAYLESEYGKEWKTPKDDSTSRLRNYGFLRKRNLGPDYLKSDAAAGRTQ